MTAINLGGQAGEVRTEEELKRCITEFFTVLRAVDSGELLCRL